MPIPLYLRTKAIKAIIVFAFLAGCLLSPQLWIGKGRFFPMIRLNEHLFTLIFPFDVLFLALFIGLSVFWIFYPKRAIGWLTIMSLLMMLSQDQMRWQPWVYLYLLLLLPYLFQSPKSEDAKAIMNCMQWMISGVYVWSGIHKLNLNFLDTTFSQMITAFGVNMEYLKWRNIGYIIPIIEISIGLALLFSKVRTIGIYAAIIMHTTILTYLIQMDERHNSVVYPWNIAMILFVLLLFRGDKDNTSLYYPKIRSGSLKIIPIIMVWLLPILNLWGYWDHFLSFSFYSGKPPDFYIAIEESQVRKIAPRFQKYFVTIPGLQGGRVIDIDKWSLSELNVPFYPERNTFKKLSRNFCNLGIEQDKLVFVELSYSSGQQHFNTFPCQ